MFFCVTPKVCANVFSVFSSVSVSVALWCHCFNADVPVRELALGKGASALKQGRKAETDADEVFLVFVKALQHSAKRQFPIHKFKIAGPLGPRTTPNSKLKIPNCLRLSAAGKYRAYGKKSLQTEISFWSVAVAWRQSLAWLCCQYIWSWVPIYMELGANIYAFRVQYIWSCTAQTAVFCPKNVVFGAITDYFCAYIAAHFGCIAAYMAALQRLAAAHAKLPAECPAMLLLVFARVLSRYGGKYCPVQ